MAHSFVGHGSFMCVTWLFHMQDMTHSYARHDSFTCETWLIHMCNITQCVCVCVHESMCVCVCVCVCFHVCVCVHDSETIIDRFREDILESRHIGTRCYKHSHAGTISQESARYWIHYVRCLDSNFFCYWKQYFRTLAWGSICSNPCESELTCFRPESNRGLRMTRFLKCRSLLHWATVTDESTKFR